MAAVSIHSDCEAKKNEVCHCFHFPPFLTYSDGTRYHDLHFLNVVLSSLFQSPLSPLSRGSLVLLCFLPLVWCHLCIWGYWHFSWNLDSTLCFFQPGILCDVKVAVWQYSLDILLFQFWISLFFHSSSNCCFLTCIQVSQEAGKVVKYSHLCKNFSQFVVIHTVKDFSVVSEADCFFNSFGFSMIQRMLSI